LLHFSRQILSGNKAFRSDRLTHGRIANELVFTPDADALASEKHQPTGARAGVIRSNCECETAAVLTQRDNVLDSSAELSG
jgi:hypothetical protein